MLNPGAFAPIGVSGVGSKPPEVVLEAKEVEVGGLGRHTREVPPHC